MKKIWLVLIVIIIVVGAILWFRTPRTEPNTSPPSPSSTQTTPSSSHVASLDLQRFTNPTARFIAELANFLIEKTK